MSLSGLRRNTLRRTSLVSAALLAGALITACGSGTDTSSAAGGSPRGSAECASQSGDLVADQLDAKAQAPYPTDALDASVVKGKNYWVVLLSAAVPTQADYAKGFQAAAVAAGAQAQVFDGKGTAATVIQGINAAIAAKADGIITVAVDLSQIDQALADAAAAGIPVVDGSNGNPNAPFPKGNVGHVTLDSAEVGTWQANYALKATGCDTHAVIVGTLSAPTSLAVVDGAKNQIASLCGDDCTTEVVDVRATDLGPKLVGMLQTTLQRNPNTNVILSATNVYDPDIKQALSALGRDIPVVSLQTEGVLAGNSDAGPLIANVVYAPATALGWFYFDGMIKAAAGQTNFAVKIPVAMIDESNWGTDPSTPQPPRYSGYEAEFAKLWSLKND
ncbi:ABC sugar transporter, periplasmic substrate binding protein (plasmid) [Rhodococcus jostii RHA1]|uniref:ABC sugar transporter, periplasmic substrate binding protein n=1 Tax=Rhodococcus jostii (strain RHA1) TaxID=101510 RepID=Q0RV63_RHOJR|nr:substrate-binding domain-containing protein [Rhodococcus jostii]ABH00823.1 ABC sugar transporter, periplasmic substrate binding protein [Rhodococcus jostii RHA1]